jgi:hypothetical protein
MNSPAPGTVPPNYHEVLHWKITQSRWRLLGVYLLTIPVGVGGMVAFLLFAIRFGRLLEVRLNGTMIEVVVPAMVALILIIVLHELTHGLTAQFYGARPQYAFSWKGLMPYVTTSGYAFTRNQYLVFLLMPLVGLNLLLMLGIIALAGSLMVVILVTCAVGNTAGSSGDLGIAMIVARYPAQAYVAAEHDGVRVFLPM